MSDIKALLSQDPLFVFALESEARHHFSKLPLLFIGIGKVNAVYHLTRKILEKRPSIIVNLGSAGSSKHVRGQVVCCTRFIQRDMDVRPLGFEKYITPFLEGESILTNGLKLEHLPQGACGTGDNFEVGHTTDDYDVIDMEAYGLAFVAQQEKIPFLCLKYITDGADGQAAEDWQTALEHAAEALKGALQL